MSIGYRIFLVRGDDVSRLSQKNFDEFYRKRKRVLSEFAGQTIDIAKVIYELANRRPSRVIRVDCQRYKVKADGSIDEAHNREFGRLMRIKMSKAFGTRESERNTTVVDAHERFEERRLEHKHLPSLSSVAVERMARELFG